MKPRQEQSVRTVIKFIFNVRSFSSLILLDPAAHPANVCPNFSQTHDAELVSFRRDPKVFLEHVAQNDAEDV